MHAARRPRRLAASGLALVAALALWGAVSAAVSGGAQTGRLGFVARQSEVELHGTFERFSADVDFDPARPEAGRIRVAIDPASVDAGSGDADALLRSAAFFDVQRFPGATFESTSIAAGEGGRLVASGPLTLKGRSANVAVAFTARREGTAVWYEGGAKISRLAYGIGEGQWSDTGTLDDDVLIEFRLRIAR